MRLSLGAMMLTHAIPKLRILFSGNASEWLDPLGIGPVFSLILACGAEFAGSILIMAGLFTRTASLVLAVNMAVAAFVFQSGLPFGQRELAALYFAMYVSLALAGGGDYSLSWLLSKRFDRFGILKDA